jgi:hypothetical protein
MPCMPGDIQPQCDSSGFGGWGGGFSGGTGWGSDPRPGLGVIAAAETTYNHWVFQNLPIDEATVLPVDFQRFTSWLGLFFQGPVPQPHPTPTPQPAKPSNFGTCFNGWRFSATVDYFTKGSRLNGAARFTAQALEIGPPLSLASDVGATALKATRTGIGGTTNPYASGLNFFFRRAAPASIKGSLIKFGTKATPILSGIGAFTGGFNLAMAVQCGLGIIQ